MSEALSHQILGLAFGAWFLARAVIAPRLAAMFVSCAALAVTVGFLIAHFAPDFSTLFNIAIALLLLPSEAVAFKRIPGWHWYVRIDDRVLWGVLIGVCVLWVSLRHGNPGLVRGIEVSGVAMILAFDTVMLARSVANPPPPIPVAPALPINPPRPEPPIDWPRLRVRIILLNVYCLTASTALGASIAFLSGWSSLVGAGVGFAVGVVGVTVGNMWLLRLFRREGEHP